MFDGQVQVMSAMSNAPKQTPTPTTSTTETTLTTSQSSSMSESSTSATSSSQTPTSAASSHTFATSTRNFGTEASEEAAVSSSSNNKQNVALIAGLTVGSILGVFLLIGIHCLCRCHRRRRIRRVREATMMPYNVKHYEHQESRLSWMAALMQRKAKNNIPCIPKSIAEEEDPATFVAELPAEDICTVIPGRVELPNQSDQVISTVNTHPHPHNFLQRQDVPLQLRPGRYTNDPSPTVSQFSSQMPSRAVSQISPITDGFQNGQMSQVSRPASYPLQYPRYYAHLSDQSTLIDDPDQSFRPPREIDAESLYRPTELPATPVAPEHLSNVQNQS